MGKRRSFTEETLRYEAIYTTLRGSQFPSV